VEVTGMFDSNNVTKDFTSVRVKAGVYPHPWAPYTYPTCDTLKRPASTGRVRVNRRARVYSQTPT